MMTNKQILHLHKVEELVDFLLEESQVGIPYKRYDQTWIRADKSLRETYAANIKTSELQFYPNSNFKAWLIYILKALKGEMINQSFKRLLGIGLTWHFAKIVELPLRANVIYYRHHAVAMIYTEEKKVIKAALTNWGKRNMNNEIKSQRLASSIISKDIFIPSIIQEFRQDGFDFTVEDYFEGKPQAFKNRSLMEDNYRKVFQFLLEFYLRNPIELQNLSESKFLNHDFVEEFIRNQKHGEEVVSIFKNLQAKKKKMIICRVHGDLSHNNVLSNDEQVCIIDWGKSKQDYLSRDLDNTSYYTESVYNDFIHNANIDRDEVFSYHEHLFLGRFIEMSRLIHNGIKRKTITNAVYARTKAQNSELLKMGEKL